MGQIDVVVEVHTPESEKVLVIFQTGAIETRLFDVRPGLERVIYITYMPLAIESQVSVVSVGCSPLLSCHHPTHPKTIPVNTLNVAPISLEIASFYWFGSFKSLLP